MCNGAMTLMNGQIISLPAEIDLQTQNGWLEFDGLYGTVFYVRLHRKERQVERKETPLIHFQFIGHQI